MTYRVVVGVDGSPHGDAALRWALEEADKHDGGEVTAVYAWQVPFVSIPGAFDRDELEKAGPPRCTRPSPCDTGSRYRPCG